VNTANSVLTGKCDSNYKQLTHAVTVSLTYEPDIDWPVKSDLPTAACRLISWTTAQRAGRQRAVTALPCHCYARHTCSRCSGTWIEMQVSFLSMQPCVSLAAESNYCWSLSLQQTYQYRRRHEHQHIVFTDMQRHKYSLTNIRYRSNTIVFRQSHLETVPQDNTTIFSLFQSWISLSRVRIRI